MANLTRDEILARKIGKGTATLPDGSTVGVRALTRDEVLDSQELSGLAERDNFIIAAGMTDPVMTQGEVADWAAKADAGDLVAVSDRIAELSGLKAGAGKSGVPATRKRTRS
jgi:hypothetical protein